MYNDPYVLREDDLDEDVDLPHCPQGDLEELDPEDDYDD